MQVAVIKKPLKEPHCGDQAFYWETMDKVTLCIVDGLGHGKNAEYAALLAINTVKQHLNESIPDIFARCNDVLRNTRGVAMGMAVINRITGSLTYAGIGNTRALVIGSGTTILNNSYGIVGSGYKKLKPNTVQLEPSDLVILATDGFKKPIDISTYDNKLRTDVNRLAKTIFDEFVCHTDDAAILCMHEWEMKHE